MSRLGLRRGDALLLAGIVLVALNLRFSITSVGPLIDDLRHDLGLSSAAVGLLTTAPLLALGLIAPFAPVLAHRFGAERVLLGCLAAIALGIALRLPSAIGLLFGGTVLAGCGIAIGNVLMPGIVKRRFGSRAPIMIGVYSASLNGGAALAAGLTVPLRDAVGGSWRTALALWGIPALLAALLWLPQLRAVPPPSRVARATRARISLWRDRRAWKVTLLMGLQSLLFYSVAAWLPDIFHAHGISTGSAGLLTSLAMVVGIPSSLLMSFLASRRDDQRPVLAVAVGATAVGLLGVMIAPAALAVLWIVVLGFGQGACFALALSFTVLRSPDASHAAELAGMAQSVGYTLAALGPLLLGALHDVSGGWTLPLGVAVALIVPELIAGLAAAKPGFVGSPPEEPHEPEARLGDGCDGRPPLPSAARS